MTYLDPGQSTEDGSFSSEEIALIPHSKRFDKNLLQRRLQIGRKVALTLVGILQFGGAIVRWKNFPELFKTGYAKEDYDVMNVNGFIDLLLKAAENKTFLLNLATIYSGGNILDIVKALMISANTVGTVVENFMAFKKRLANIKEARRQGFQQNAISLFFRNPYLGTLNWIEICESAFSYALFGSLVYDLNGSQNRDAIDLIGKLSDELDDPTNTKCLVTRDPDSPLSCLVMSLMRIVGTDTTRGIIMMLITVGSLYLLKSDNDNVNMWVMTSFLTGMLARIIKLLKPREKTEIYMPVEEIPGGPSTENPPPPVKERPTLNPDISTNWEMFNTNLSLKIALAIRNSNLPENARSNSTENLALPITESIREIFIAVQQEDTIKIKAQTLEAQIRDRFGGKQADLIIDSLNQIFEHEKPSKLTFDL